MIAAVLERETSASFIKEFLEITNGGTALLLFNLIAFLAWFMNDQRRRAGLSWGALVLHFREIPAVMQVTLGLLTMTSGIWLTRVVVWQWRVTTAGRLPFSLVEIGFLILASILTGIGALCLIRVVSRPGFGHGPWIFSLVEGVLFVLISILHG